MRATRCSPDQVIVVTSTQQAVELAGKVLADPGDRAWAEMPGYQPVQHCLRAAGLRIVHVPVDEQGLDVSAGRLLEPQARVAYVTPAHQYPLGYEMSLERRKALLDWATKQEAYVLEDDYDGDYRYEGRPIASLQGMDGNGRVIYIGSFNKILFPGLRIAYAIVPEALVGAFVDAKHVADGHTALADTGRARCVHSRRASCAAHPQDAHDLRRAAPGVSRRGEDPRPTSSISARRAAACT